MKQAPESYRYSIPQAPSHPGMGCNGLFLIPHPKLKKTFMQVIACDQDGWEHVSVTVAQLNKEPDRCPTWEEMCYVKDLFWEENECVIQYHPPAEVYMNDHEYCLHLWKGVGFSWPLPPSGMVGSKLKVKG